MNLLNKPPDISRKNSQNRSDLFATQTQPMKKITLPLPELALIVGTRALLGGGIAILLTDNMDRSQRRVLGWTLALVGAVTTIPLAMELLAENRSKVTHRLSEN